MKQSVSLFILFLLAACQPIPVASVATMPPPHILIETMTPSPVPTQTLTPSPTPTVEELLFPYTIEGLRQHTYKSGKIHIRATLEKNEAYTSYLIDYPSDGLTITGVMQIPVGKGPFPVIVMNHGFYSRSVYRSGDGTDRASIMLVKRGYITLASDYRSWGDSDVGTSLFYSGLVIDVINLINAVSSIPEADPSRIGMWGHSMGGGVTIKVLTIDARVKAAVLYSTVSADQADIIERWGNGCFGDIAEGEQLFGCNSSDVVPLELPLNLQTAYRRAAEDADLLKEISPIFHLSYVTAPIQIHYGIEDGKDYAGTPPEWSKKLYESLRGLKKEVELLGYDGQGHSFKPDPWFAFMGRVGRFFDEQVKNAE
jgi:dipeptidyl aminopeptidase/acylaminoacyl peptidase